MTSLDPEIARFTAALAAAWASHPPLETLTPPEARAVAEAVRAPWRQGGPLMAETRDVTVETSAGPLGLRVHRPAGVPSAAAPALLYLHGGGFVTFSLDTHDRLMREYAAAGGFVVIGIDYPLAPEHPYPIALDRVTALVGDLPRHAQMLGIDPHRMAIGGDSAGANLALATAMRLRDVGEGTALRAILSNYGAFSGVVSDAAEAAFGGPGAILDQVEMASYFERYAGSADAGRDPFAAPLYADDLAGLPPTLLVVPEADVLTEQSLDMADRLRTAGVAAREIVYPGATHSFLEAMSIAAVARRAIADGAAFVAAALAG